MIIKTLKKKLLLFLGNNLLGFVIRVLCKTVKYKIINKNCIDSLKKKNQNYVLGFWHGTMLAPWYLHRNSNFAAIVSKSKDGEILSKILKVWNYYVARGSSHKGGKEAVKQLLNFASKKKSVAITPDGPTGPEHKMKPGAVITAKKSGIPLVLVGIGYSKYYQLNSWDKFQIPRFFSTATIIYSDPVFIDDRLDFDSTDLIIKKCEQTLNKLQKEAQTFA